MLIISHSKLDSYISCNIQRVSVYIGTLIYQARRNEKNSEGEATNYVILSATMVGRRRRFLISNCLKRLEKLYICWREVM